MDSRTTLLSYLKQYYSAGQTFKAVQLVVPGLSQTTIRQHLAHFCREGLIKRYSRGIYYLADQPRPADWPALVSRYLSDGHRVYGYRSDLLMPELGESLVLVTNRESTNGREVIVGTTKVRVRRPFAKVTRTNVAMLALLDFVNDHDEAFLRHHKRVLFNYYNDHKKAFFCYQRILNFYPAKTTKKLLQLGLLPELVRNADERTRQMALRST